MRPLLMVLTVLLCSDLAHASHFIIAGGDKDPAAAKKLLEDYVAAGHPSHGAYPQVVESASIEGFNPGFHIVVVGEAFEKAVADKALVELKRRGLKGGYVKEAPRRKGEFLVLATITPRPCAKANEVATAEGPKGALGSVTLMNGAGTLFVTEDNTSTAPVSLKVKGCPDVELAKGSRLLPGYRALIPRPCDAPSEDYSDWSSDFAQVAQQSGFAVTVMTRHSVSIVRFGTVVKKLKVEDGVGYVILKEGEEPDEALHDMPRKVVQELQEYFGLPLNTDGMPW